MKDLENVKELLIVVDMINGFVREGSLSDKYIEVIIPKIELLVKKYVKDNEKEVFFIKDSHSEGSTEFSKFPIHCEQGTTESELVSELKPYEEMGRTYLKNSRSFMFAPSFITDIEKMKELRRVIVTGCCTDLCVLNGVLGLVNYLDQVNRDVEVVVNSGMVETYDAPGHEREEYNAMSLKLMRQEGVKVIGGDK